MKKLLLHTPHSSDNIPLKEVYVGIEVAINLPYSGTIVPMEHYQKKKMYNLL